MNSENIKFLIVDVDGTMTDGKIYMGESGEIFKVFDVKDGCGIKDILPKYGIIPIIITARESKILLNRCTELGISEIYQGKRDKIKVLLNILEEKSKYDLTQYGLSDCAYIGDDILDLQCMLPIKDAGGIVGCPHDAAKQVIGVASYVCNNRGGDGAVREFIEWICEKLTQ